MNSIYDITVIDINGEMVKMDAYRGDVILVVNTATECGFTPQYENLQDLYEKYHARGFAILDFPCDQFGHQAPGTNSEIATFCSTRFGVTFPQFTKIDVNGDNQSDLFRYLKLYLPFNGFDMSNDMSQMMDKMLRTMDANYEKNPDIKWNFTKFLIDRSGRPVARFEPTDSIEKVDLAINALL
ncbi:MAG: glutathione peroxidase [Alphaproteobacteria bacterium]|nr:glutathione peroxidase [Alphaproteobacteria bacterium]